MKQATAIAHANIALVKYWGKRDRQLNLPDVGSISITLEALFTKTSVIFDSNLQDDQFILNGETQQGTLKTRVSDFLNLLRRKYEVHLSARIISENNFPTGAGLASSASGFAALALASSRALGIELTPTELSLLARQGSGSAARSIFGGFVEMKKGQQWDGSDCYAVPLAAQDYWQLTVLIAITSEERKKIGSTTGMLCSKKTSPYYRSWVRSAPQDLEQLRTAIATKDFIAMAEISEFSCLKMHALAMSSQPGLIYWNGATIEIIHTIRELRQKGVPVFFTIDAGPQVKAICEPRSANIVKETLLGINGVSRVFQSGLGPDAQIIEELN